MNERLNSYIEIITKIAQHLFQHNNISLFYNEKKKYFYCTNEKCKQAFVNEANKKTRLETIILWRTNNAILECKLKNDLTII